MTLSNFSSFGDLVRTEQQQQEQQQQQQIFKSYTCLPKSNLQPLKTMIKSTWLTLLLCFDLTQ